MNGQKTMESTKSKSKICEYGVFSKITNLLRARNRFGWFACIGLYLLPGQAVANVDSPALQAVVSTEKGSVVSRSIVVKAPFEMPALQIPDFKNCSTYLITDFGAVAGDKEKTTAAIAAAIDQASIHGGKVVVPQGEWLTGKIHLKSRVNLHLDKGAVLLFSGDPNDYLPMVHSSWEGMECYNYSPLIYAYECENVAITGEGTLKAQMDTWQTWFTRPRPHMESLKRLYNMAMAYTPVEERVMVNDTAHLRPQFIQFNRCKNVLLDGFSVRNSPFWTVHLYLCSDVLVRQLDLYAHGHNNDGIDPEMTQNLLIESCVFDQGDDAIAIKSGRNPEGWRLKTPSKNIVVKNCTVKNGHQLLALGSELSGGIENVFVDSCRVMDGAKLYNLVFIKTNERMGGYVDGVYVSHIQAGRIEQSLLGIETDVLYQWRNLVPTVIAKQTPIKRIQLSDMHATEAAHISRIMGQAEWPVKNVVMKNTTVDKLTDVPHVHENVLNVDMDIPSRAMVAPAEIYVAPNGSDRAQGSQEAPMASLHAALRQARELRRLSDKSIENGIHIYLKGGTYYLDESVLIRPEDAGTAQSPTIVQAVANEKVVLSGGRLLDASLWKKAGKLKGLPSSAQGKVWMIPQPKVAGRYLQYRQWWLNGQKTIRARQINDESYPRIVAWDKKEQVLTIPTPSVSDFQTLDGMELVLHQMWAIANLRVKSIEREGELSKVQFHQPESRIQGEHPCPTPMTKEGLESPYYLCNAIEFLDQPGEWYLDNEAHVMYYWPRSGENLRKSEAVVPFLETLVDVQGTLDRNVQYFRFENIGFSHSTWMRPSFEGHVPLQAGMYLLDAYKLRPSGVPGNENRGLENQGWIGRPAAAVMLRGTRNTTFKRCRFEHLASCGVDYLFGTWQDSIVGCVFKDIGGNGIQAGKFSDVGIETHLPYDPSDERELCRKMYIADNYITDCTNEDWGCVGICAGNVRDITIEHNELSELSYTGISLGWCWTKTVNTMRNNMVRANYIHHYAKHMYDVAGIYTLSVQSKSSILENVIDSIYSPAYVHDPNHWFYLYTDEGSSFITVKNNWCPAQKFLQNANGPGNTWENNGPMVSPEIKKAAGIRSAYLDIK